ncbi:wax ester/triacylglycerol synthase domain-containing protein [Blastococcus sp. KM273129]|uniref:wax ester/triacylglycerol synthase domain-containing protein n=1 Tax=Blastococcus sp. KM273129 TaxID=2570315 RepID=UPI001EFF6B10|nr:wax ester/triacylglycerol synthase domain-containing protein [Blastococcus sp. KM273129]MCF6734335.1 DUF1298 domain-containing protein [Blastococcus sp. KM273129]
MATDQPIDRASPADRAMAAMGRRGRPGQLGVLLLLGTGPADDLHAVERLLVSRLASVPRLRRRLLAAPPLAGPPVWVDDPAFAPDRHVRHLPWPGPGEEDALLGLAADVVGRRLPRDRPLWSATILTGYRRAAVLLVVDHAVLDGIGGMAVLDRLLDGHDAPPVGSPAGTSRPAYARLVADAWRARIAGVRRLRRALPELRRALSAGGGAHPGAAAPCSLLAPTGGRVALAVARAALAPLRATAHRSGASVNDALLAAVAAALGDLLRHRGEHLDVLRVAVMVSGRRTARADRPGNAAAPLVVAVPVGGGAEEGLRTVAGVVAARREQAAGPSLPALLGPVFRVLAAGGCYRWYLRRQRRMHTLVSDVAGPPVPRSLGGVPVTAVVPVAVGESGNLTVSFTALSYAGTLTVTAVADAGAVTDLPVLREALQRRLDELAGVSPGTARRG